MTPAMEDRVYAYLVAYLGRNGYPPSLREVMAGCGIRSTDTAQRYLRALVSSGKIAVTPGKARAIRLLELP